MSSRSYWLTECWKGLMSSVGVTVWECNLALWGCSFSRGSTYKVLWLNGHDMTCTDPSTSTTTWNRRIWYPRDRSESSPYHDYSHGVIPSGSSCFLSLQSEDQRTLHSFAWVQTLLLTCLAAQSPGELTAQEQPSTCSWWELVCKHPSPLVTQGSILRSVLFTTFQRLLNC